MYCSCFLYLLSLCVVCHYNAYTSSFLLVYTVLCLVPLLVSSLRSWIKYCGVLLFLLVCLPSVVCVFVLLLVCILLMHFSTFCTFTFSTFILIFLLFILMGTQFIWGQQPLGCRGCQLGCGISCMYVHAMFFLFCCNMMGVRDLPYRVIIFLMSSPFLFVLFVLS